MAGPTGLKPALTSVTRKDTVNCATIPKSFRSLPDATRKSLWVALEFNTVCPTTSDQPSTGNTRPRFVFKLPKSALGSSPTSELTSNLVAEPEPASGDLLVMSQVRLSFSISASNCYTLCSTNRLLSDLPNTNYYITSPNNGL